MTQSAVARELGVGQAKIHKIETTLVAVSLTDLDALIDLYNIPTDTAVALRELAKRDQQAGPWRTSWSAYKALTDLEVDAAEILCWHSERIPGPLQSELYIVRQLGQQSRTSPDAVQLIRARLARASIFTTPSPPRYRVILSESSLHRLPGGRTAQLVADQARHLLKISESYEQVELRILTFNANVEYVDSDFELLRFAHGQDEIAYIEYAGGSRILKSRHELQGLQQHWEELSRAALSQDDSGDFLRRLISEPPDRS